MSGIKHTGDDGFTSLLGAGRVAKDAERMEALGAVDETNAALGIARNFCRSPKASEILLRVQRDLYGLMAEVAATPENAAAFRTIHAARVEWLEEQIERIDHWVQMPGEFIVPGDTPAGAFLDLARTVARRAERRAAALFHKGELQNIEILRYLNRLSTLVFAMELLENQVAGKDRPTLAKTQQEPDGNSD